MRVLHISNYYPPHIGGIESVAYDVVRALKNKYTQKVICFGTDEKTIEEEYDNVSVIRVSYLYKIKSQAISFEYYKVLKKAIEEFKPQVIHLHLPNPLIVYYLNKIKYDTFLIIHHHLDITKQRILKLLVSRQNKKIYKKSDVIIATSKNYLEHSKEISVFEKKVEIIHNVVDENLLDMKIVNSKKLEELKQKYANKFIGFFIGRHVKYKGLKYLIKAYKNLDDNHLCFIAGSGNLTKKLKKHAKNAKNIIFLGKISNEEKIIYMQLSHITLFPSITKNEAFGIALAEGLYLGKPAVTFDVKDSGLVFVNLNNVTGIVVKLYDYKAFKVAVEKLKSDKNLYHKLSNGAKKRTKELFSKVGFTAGILKLYDRICTYE